MPTVPEPNKQLCTFTQASDLAIRLNAIGVTVETIYEIQENGNRVDTTSDQFVDNRKLHQYVAKIWGGPEQNLGITNAMFVEKGYTYESFVHLAAVSNKTPPEVAIVPLKGNVEAINVNLHRQMRETDNR